MFKNFVGQKIMEKPASQSSWPSNARVGVERWRTSGRSSIVIRRFGAAFLLSPQALRLQLFRDFSESALARGGAATRLQSLAKGVDHANLQDWNNYCNINTVKMNTVQQVAFFIKDKISDISKL